MSITKVSRFVLEDSSVSLSKLDTTSAFEGQILAVGAGNTLQFEDKLVTEDVEDIVAGLLVRGNHTNIAIAYADGSNQLNLSATGAVTSVNGQTGVIVLGTDDLAEGSTNLYYTDARARASISVTDNSGDGSVSYDSSTGVISYTGPSAAEVRTHISGGTGVTITNGEIAIGQSVATTDDVEFADLVLTGDLTVQGTTTTINTETINLADNIILLNSNETGSPTQSGGLEIERGTALNVQFVWDENLDRWSLGAEDLYTSGTFLGDVTGDVTGTVSSLANHDTDDLAEGTNLYYTQSRVDARVTAGFAIRSTTDLSEGTNLYYTDARARSAISVSGDLTYNSSTGVISTQGLASSTTDDLAEGTANLYYTESRTDTRVNILRTDLGVSGDANVHFDNISNIPAVTKDVLTGDNSTTAFTMSVTPGNADAVIVTMNGVTQMPGSDYTVSGTTITFTTTPPSGQVILVRHVGYQIVGSVADNDLSITGGTMTGSILVGTDDTYDLGSSTKQWRTIYGHEVESTYADLAERYEADKKLAVGTVVVFGGDKEVTECLEEIDVSVAGIISGKPALKMNSDAGSDDTHPYIALKGRVPCQVIGPVSKGDLLVTSSTPGFAKSVGKRDMGCAVFAKAIETNLENGRKLVEVVVI